MVFDGRYTARFPNLAQGPGSRRLTGHAIADAMLGWTWRSATNLPEGEDIKVPSWAFYAQDDWRITPRLTLNLGLRYELFLQPRVKTGNGLQNARAVWSGQVDEVSPVLPVRFEVWESPDGGDDCGCRLDYSNFAPRIGIAYRITDNTVIRAGGGLYYSENGTAGIMSNRFNSGGPQVLNSNISPGSREIPATTVSAGFPLYEINEPDPNLFEFTFLGSGGASNVPFYKDTISVGQWFLDIQHQLPWNILMTVGYNGNSAGHLPWWNRNWGSPLEPGELPARHVTRRRTPSPVEANTVRQLFNWQTTGEHVLNSSYNAFTFKTEKRFSDGLSFTSSFTWSKGLDYGISSLNERTEGITGGGNPLTPYAKDLWRNRGPGALSRDFAYNLSVLYELPAGPGKGRFESGPAGWVLGGWQLGTILSLQSGPWATTRFTPDTQNTGGAYRGILAGEPNLPELERDSMAWWNPSAIVAGPAAEFGDVGRGILEMPGFKNIDFLLSKYFVLPWEGHRIQFRFEAFNFTNTPHLGGLNNNPVFQINAASAASGILTRASQPRIIQFALKYTF